MGGGGDGEKCLGGMTVGRACAVDFSSELLEELESDSDSDSDESEDSEDSEDSGACSV